jgi:hypothetical protein
MKTFIVSIDFSPIEIRIEAKNKIEAKKKALNKLRRKNAISLISSNWRTRKRDISVDEL